MQQQFVRDLQQQEAQNMSIQAQQLYQNSIQSSKTLILQNSPQHQQNQLINNPISKQNVERNESFDESYYSYQEVDNVDNQHRSNQYNTNNLYTTENQPLYTENDSQSKQQATRDPQTVENMLLDENEIEKTKHLTHKQLTQYSLIKYITQILIPSTAVVQIIALIGYLFASAQLQYWQLIFVLLFIFLDILVCLSQFQIKRFTPFITQYALLMRHELCPLITQLLIINIYPYAFVTQVQQAFSALMLISLLPYIALVCCYCIRVIYVKNSTPGKNSYFKILKTHSFNNKFQQRHKHEQELYNLEKKQKQEATNSIISNRTRVEPKNSKVYSILEDAKISVLSKKDLNKIVGQLIKATQQSQEQYLSLLVDTIRKYNQNILYQINLFYFGRTARNLWEPIHSQDTTMKETIFCFFNQRGDTLDYIINKMIKQSHMLMLHFLMYLQPDDVQLLNTVTQQNYKQDIMRRIGSIPFFNELNTRYFFAQLISNANQKTNVVYIHESNQSVDTLGSAFELVKQIQQKLQQDQPMEQSETENYKQIIFNILTKTDELFYQKLNALVRDQLGTELPQLLKQLLQLNDNDILLQLVKTQHSILLDRKQALHDELFKNIPLESPMFIFFLSIFGTEFRRKLADSEINKILAGNYESVCMSPLILAVFGVYQDATGLHVDEPVTSVQQNQPEKNNYPIDDTSITNPTIKQQPKPQTNDDTERTPQNINLQHYQNIAQQLQQPQEQQQQNQVNQHVQNNLDDEKSNSINSNSTPKVQQPTIQQPIPDNVNQQNQVNNQDTKPDEKSKSESTELSFSF